VVESSIPDQVSTATPVAPTSSTVISPQGTTSANPAPEPVETGTAIAAPASGAESILNASPAAPAVGPVAKSTLVPGLQGLVL
jgi:hypothetical protein